MCMMWLLREENGSLEPKVIKRRDGIDASIRISSTILNHVITQKESVLTCNAPS